MARNYKHIKVAKNKSKKCSLTKLNRRTKKGNLSGVPAAFSEFCETNDIAERY